MDLLKENSPVALYHQLKEILAKKIIDKEWKVGDKIPTEVELCEQYDVSRITVRQALSELEKEGFVVRKQGRGTFISIPKIEQNLMSFYSFSDEFKKRGLQPRTDVLEFTLELPHTEIRRNLGLPLDSAVYYFKRLRYADDVLMAIESTYLPGELFPGLSKAELLSKPLYDIMRSKYNIVTSSAEESFGATLIGLEDAALFGLKKGAAGLHLERFTFSGNTCVEYTTGIIRGDKFRFHVNLK